MLRLQGQIRVAIRVRPILKSEVGTTLSVKFPAMNAISVVHGSKSSGQCEFEKVFTPVFTQKEVFDNIEDFIMVRKRFSVQYIQ